MKRPSPPRDLGRRFEMLEERRLLSAVAGRHIFYNQSSFDGNNAAIDAADDGAIAPDKTAYFAIDQLTDNATFDSQPRVWGDQIVWQGVGGSDMGSDDEIFWYDGTTITQLTENTAPDQFPKISQLGIAWERGVGAAKKIVYHDTVDETELPGTPLGNFQNVFTLTDDRLTWEDAAEADFEIVTWNNTGNPTKLSNNAVTDRYAHGDGDSVVWVEIDGATRNVRYFNGTTTTTIGTSTNSIEDPNISGNIVAWEGFKAGGNNEREIYWYNGSIEQRITTNSFPEFDPQVAGTNIVWWGLELGVSHVYLFDGSTTRQLSTGMTNQFPKIDGNNVVWQGDDGNDFEIFWYDGQSVVQLTDNDVDDTNPQISGNHVVWQGSVPNNGNTSEIFHTYIFDRAQPANVTSFTRGITGIMVDLAGDDGDHAAITTADFAFKVGTDNTPATWALAPPPSDLQIRLGEGDNDSDRIVVTWPTGAIANQWLQVQVLDTANTGLLARDIHYWGNRVGDSGTGTPAAVFQTTTADAAQVFGNLTGGAAIDNLRDYNRSGSVTTADAAVVFANLGTLTRLSFGVAPPAPSALPDGADGTSSAIASALAASASADDPPAPASAVRPSDGTRHAAWPLDVQGVARAHLLPRTSDVSLAEERLEEQGLDALWHDLAALARRRPAR